MTTHPKPGWHSLEQWHEATRLLGQRCIAYHPRLAQLTGRVTAGLMLSQALYWTRKLAVAEPYRSGWFWKTRDDWLSETGLSRREQDSARAALKRLDLLQERRVGMPARVWYRIDLECLGRHLAPEGFLTWDWRNERALLQLLGRPYLFYRTLSDVTGAVTAALLMSNLLGQERTLLRNGEALAGWRGYQFEPLRQQTGLTRHELDHARRLLRQIALIVERRVGLPPRVEWQVRLERLGALLAADNRRPEAIDPVLRQLHPSLDRAHAWEASEVVPSGLPHDSRLDRRLPADRSSGIVPTDLPITIQQGFQERTDRHLENVPTEWAHSVSPVGTFPENHYVVKTTGLRLPTTPSARGHEAQPGPSDEAGGRWFDDLVWPDTLSPEERAAAGYLLAPLPSQAQILLDELAGQSSSRKRIEQPLNYLAVLARKARSGEFIATAAPREQSRRTAPVPATSDSIASVASDPGERQRQIREGLSHLRGFMAERISQRRRG